MPRTMTDRVYEGAPYLTGDDIRARLAELEQLGAGACPDDCREAHEHRELDEDQIDEGERLARLADELEDRAGRPDAALISDAAFEDYARELAQDLGVDPDAWPGTRVDWAAAAEDLRQDFARVTYGVTDYWVRG